MLRYYIVDLSHTHIWVLSQYIVQIVREDLTASEAEFDSSSSHQVCSLVQVSPKGGEFRVIAFESSLGMRFRLAFVGAMWSTADGGFIVDVVLGENSRVVCD